jgi:hypothetical protein
MVHFYEGWRFAPIAALLLLSPEPTRAEMAGQSQPSSSREFDGYRRGFADGYQARGTDRPRSERRGNERWSPYSNRLPRYQRQDRYAYSPYWWRRPPRTYGERYPGPSWQGYDDRYRGRAFRDNRFHTMPLVHRWYGHRGWVRHDTSASH